MICFLFSILAVSMYLCVSLFFVLVFVSIFLWLCLYSECCMYVVVVHSGSSTDSSRKEVKCSKTHNSNAVS